MRNVNRRTRIRSVVLACALALVVSQGAVAPASAATIKSSFILTTTTERIPDGRATANVSVQWTSAFSFRVNSLVTDHCASSGAGDGENAQLDAVMRLADGSTKTVRINADNNGCQLFAPKVPNTWVLVARSASSRILNVQFVLSEKNADGGYADSISAGEVAKSLIIRNPLR